MQSPSNGLYGSDTGAAGTFSKLTRATSTARPPSPSRTGSAASRSARPPARSRTTATCTRWCRTPGCSTAAARSVDGDPGRCRSSCATRSSAPARSRAARCSRASTSRRTSARPGPAWVTTTPSAATRASGSALVGLGTAIGYEPGVQGWYNQWVQPDPTSCVHGCPDPPGLRPRGGLGERDVPGVPNAVDGVGDSFKVIGRYFAGDSCQLLSLGLPTCPTNRAAAPTATRLTRTSRTGCSSRSTRATRARACTCSPATTAACTARPSPPRRPTTRRTATATRSASPPVTSTTGTGAAAPTRASTPCCPTTPRWPRTAPSGPACRTTAT